MLIVVVHIYVGLGSDNLVSQIIGFSFKSNQKRIIRTINSRVNLRSSRPNVLQPRQLTKPSRSSKRNHHLRHAIPYHLHPTPNPRAKIPFLVTALYRSTPTFNLAHYHDVYTPHCPMPRRALVGL